MMWDDWFRAVHTYPPWGPILCKPQQLKKVNNPTNAGPTEPSAVIRRLHCTYPLTGRTREGLKGTLRRSMSDFGGC